MVSFRIRAALAGTVVAVAAATTVVAGAGTGTAATSSPNLLKNGNAEAAAGGWPGCGKI